jgi:hypothetical protein
MTYRRFPAAVAAFAAAVALAGIGGASIAVAAVPRQVGTLTFTTSQPGAAGGTVLDVDFQNPDDPNAKPYAVETMVIHMPPGTVTDTTVPPQCHATDAEIYLQGPAACPPDSKIGSGLAVSDNGPGSSPRYDETELTHFNNQDEIVGIGVNKRIPAIKTIDRTQIEGDTTTSFFPLFPGFPPPEPYTPVKSLDVTLPAYERDGRIYNRTPPTCPGVGYWTFVLDFNYRDGGTESIESRSPCTP